ncbi:MAG: FAD-dependent monooxygenase [Bacteroidia bacterium]
MKILIIGGGIGGLCTAIALKNKGFEPVVYEKVPELKGLGAGIVIATNAIRALRDIGIADAVLKGEKIFERGGIYSQEGKLISANITPDIVKKFGDTSHAVHRADLHNKLISLLGEANIVTGKGCKEARQEGEKVVAVFEDGSTAEGDALIAADGIHSAVRRQLVPSSTIRYSGYTCWRGVVNMHPEDMDMDQFSESWGANGRFGVVPLARNRVYWFATKNAPQNDTEMARWKSEDLLRNFGKYHAPIPQLLENTPDEAVLWNDIVDLKPLKQFAFGKIMLLGDAAHATTPNLGQGACMAIEDAAVVANCLKARGKVEDAFRLAEQMRIGRTTEIVNRSWTLGKIGQWENAVLAGLRNALLRMVPDSVTEKQLENMFSPKLYPALSES